MNKSRFLNCYSVQILLPNQQKHTNTTGVFSNLSLEHCHNAFWLGSFSQPQFVWKLDNLILLHTSNKLQRYAYLLFSFISVSIPSSVTFNFIPITPIFISPFSIATSFSFSFSLLFFFFFLILFTCQVLINNTLDSFLLLLNKGNF